MKGKALENLRAPSCPDRICLAQSADKCQTAGGNPLGDRVHTPRALAALDVVQDWEFTLKLAVFGRGFKYDKQRDRSMVNTLRKEVERRREYNSAIAEHMTLPEGDSFDVLLNFLQQKPCNKCSAPPSQVCTQKEHPWGPLCLARIYSGVHRPLQEWPSFELYNQPRDVAYIGEPEYKEDAILWLMRFAIDYNTGVLRRKGLI